MKIINTFNKYFSGVQFTIQLGSNKLDGTDPNRVTLATATFVIHPGYNPDTLENDVGLIRLRLPIEFNRKFFHFYEA
jgi:hypothetical protein